MAEAARRCCGDRLGGGGHPEDGALLVRPDGYIAQRWRWGPAHGEVLSQAPAALLGRR